MAKTYTAPKLVSHERVRFETAVSSSNKVFTWYDPTGDDFWKKSSPGYQLVDPTNDDTFTQS